MISDQMTSLRLLLTHQYSEFIDIKDFNCSKELKVQNIHIQTIWGWHVKLISNTLLFAVYMNSTLYYSNAFSYCPFEYFDKEWTYLHWIFWSRILRILLKYIWTHFFYQLFRYILKEHQLNHLNWNILRCSTCYLTLPKLPIFTLLFFNKIS